MNNYPYCPEPPLEPPEAAEPPIRCFKCNKVYDELLSLRGGTLVCRDCLIDMIEDAKTLDDVAAIVCADIVGD